MKAELDILDKMIETLDAVYRDSSAEGEVRRTYTAMRGMLTAARGFIEALGDEWIPVTERNPKALDEMCLLYTTEEKIETGYIDQVGNWHNIWGYTFISDITHWQPLPNPPKK